MKSLITTLKVDVQLIHGHAVGHNPNKVVDLISNSVLRMTKKETKVCLSYSGAYLEGTFSDYTSVLHPLLVVG